MRKTFAEYLIRTSQVRELSTPFTTRVSSEEYYGDALKENFIQIGKLSVENRRLIQEELMPMLEHTETLDKEDIDDLLEFARMLLSEYHLRTLDPDLGWYIADSFSVSLTDGIVSEQKFRLLELRLLAAYHMYLKTRRIEAVSGLPDRFRKSGLDILDYFESWLDPEKLAGLPDETMRAMVITNSRFGHCMYEGEHSDAKSRKKDIEGLERLLSLSKDPAVRDLIPHFDWDYHNLCTLEYLALSVDYGNVRGFSLSERKHLYQYACSLYELWNSDPERYSAQIPADRVNLAYLLNAYQAGIIDKETYKNRLLEFSKAEGSDSGYDRDSIYGIFHAALAYLICVKKAPTKEEKSQLAEFYKKVLECALHSEKATVESYILETVSLLMENYIEVPGYPFEKMALACMAALHTPSYIHSLMVADLTRYIVANIIHTNPDLLSGLFGCGSAQEIKDKRDEVLEASYRAALLHDVGKISIIDTIFIYERKLLDFEFNEIIKMHVLMGKFLLDQYEDTRKYSIVACGHHRWYDCSAGYPGIELGNSALILLVHIVECVDCMEAATDFIGRSYNPGKTLDEFLNELRDGSGSRYAPWLPDILDNPKTRQELKEILTDGRKHKYRDTYQLLHGKTQIK